MKMTYTGQPSLLTWTEKHAKLVWNFAFWLAGIIHKKHTTLARRDYSTQNQSGKQVAVKRSAL
jgi:hypothetical protein